MLYRNRIILVILAVLVFAADCSQKKEGTGKIRVVVSILPLAEFAEQIGGDRVNVLVMVPPGASPHAYEPTPGQLAAVSKAKMYIKVGTPIEFELVWLDKILATNNEIFVCNAAHGIKRLSQAHSDKHQHKSDDPHIWLSPKNVKKMVANICDGFVTIDPSNKEYHNENKKAYLKQLEDLDIDIEKALSGKINREFMVYHPSWNYFARDYNLEQIPIEIKGKEPTARQIRRVIELAEEHGIKIIFASPQFNTESAEVIAKEIRGRVVLINPLEKDYIENMRRIAQVMSEVME